MTETVATATAVGAASSPVSSVASSVELDDPDGYDELVFNRYMMDCIGKGIPIIWEDML